MLEVLVDSFSRKRAESAKLISSANAEARNMRQAVNEISAWCTRDEIRQEAHDTDTHEYLLNSIAYIERIRDGALERRATLETLINEAQAKREQLHSDAEELREFDMIGPTEFEGIRELDIEVLRMKQCAADDVIVYDQAVECLEDLHTRELLVDAKEDGLMHEPVDEPYEELHSRFVIAVPSRTIH